MTYNEFVSNIQTVLSLHEYSGTLVTFYEPENNSDEGYIMVRNKGNPDRIDMLLNVQQSDDTIKAVTAYVFRSCKYFKKFKMALAATSGDSFNFDFNVVKMNVKSPN